MTLWHISGGVCNDDLQINDQELTESSTCLEMCKGRLQTDKEMNTGIRGVIRRQHLFLVVQVVTNLIEGLSLKLPPQFTRFRKLIKTTDI